MLQLLFRKWWLVLLQGILLIILSIYIFQNPVEVLAGISLWFGLLVLAAGVLGIIGWLAADRPEREGMSPRLFLFVVRHALLRKRRVENAP